MVHIVVRIPNTRIDIFIGRFFFFHFILIISVFLGCLVQRSGWTRDVDIFLHWLSSIQFAGGGFSEAATAEGLAEALMVGNFIFNHLYMCLGHCLSSNF